MARIIIEALILLMLTACASQAARPQPSVVGEARTDEAVAAQVHAALNADPVYFFKHVDVQVTHGVVTLSGYVWSTQALYRAKKIAAGVPGVTDVVNQMELERNGLGPYRR